MVPCKSTAEEVSFEWSHHRISPTDSKVRTTLHASIFAVVIFSRVVNKAVKKIAEYPATILL